MNGGKELSQVPLKSSSQDIRVAAPIAPNDSWRKTRTLLAKRRHETILEVSPPLNIPDQARWTTTIGACQTVPYIAVGSAAKSNNLFIIENGAKNKFSSIQESTPGSTTQRLNATFTAPNPIYNISVTGDKLATAGPCGYVQIFQIEFNELNMKGHGLSHLTECPIGENKVEWLPLSPPGTTIGTVRIQHVELAPTGIPSSATNVSSPTKFLATQGKRLFIWDLASEKVVFDETVAQDTLPVATWSPHSPHGSLIACGSADKNLYIVDSRMTNSQNDLSNSTAWKVLSAHQGTINSIQFNPFIPYWLASAGEEGTAKVWDLRFLKHPTARIDGHFGSITSLAWSNVRCDLLSTVSSDRTWRSWMLNPHNDTPREIIFDTFFVGCAESGFHSKASRIKDNIVVGADLVAESDPNLFNGPLVSVCASPTHSDSFYILSSLGELVHVTMRDELFDQMAPHKYDSLRSPREYDVESSVYSRDLASAYTGIIMLSKAARAEGKMVADNEAELIDLCTPRPPIDAESWSMAPYESEAYRTGGAEMVDRMKSELYDFTYYLPPGFATEFPQWLTSVPAKVRLEFEMVVLRFNILIDIGKGFYEKILKAEKMICKGLETDPQFLDGDMLRLLVEAVVPNELIRGMQLGLRFCEIVEDTPSKKFLEVFDTVHTLLFPTVFEKERWLPNVDPSLPPLKVRSTFMKQGKLKDWIDMRKNDTHIERSSSIGHALNDKKRTDQVHHEEGGRRKSGHLALGSANVLGGSEAHLVKRSTLEKYLIDPKVALKMVRMEIQLQKAIDKAGDSVDEEIIKIMSTIDSRPGQTHDKVSKQRETTISSHANRLYLDALLNLSKFEDFFISSMELIATYPNTDYMKMILELSEREAIPKLKLHVDSLYQKASSQLGHAIQAGQQHPLPRKDAPGHDSATPVLTDSLTSSIKTFKDAILQIIGIGLSFATAVDAKVTGGDSFFLDCIERMVILLTGFLSQLYLSLCKTVDTMENILARLPSPQSIILKLSSMQYQMVRDAMVEAVKPWPSSQKSGAIALAALRDPTANFVRVMLPLHDEINKMTEKLSKLVSVKTGEGSSS